MAEEYIVKLVENWTFLNARGNPVAGYRISFETPEGYEGYVEIPRAQLGSEAADEAIKVEIAKLRAVYEL